MADWGLYTALRGVDDWQQKRADKALSLQIAEKRNIIAEQKVKEQAAYEAEIVKYFNAIGEMDVMPEDAQRIQELASDEQKRVVQQIAKYNGDLRRFMTSGGMSVLNSYQNNIMKSEEVATALQNKANITSFVTAMKEDKFIHPVVVNIPTGEIDTKGNPIYKQEETTFEKAMALKKQGIINELPSISYEDKIDINSLDFHKTFKNNADPYSIQVVTQNDLRNRLIEQGASEQQANFRALEYGQRVKDGGSPMYWNRKDPFERDMELERLNLTKQRFSSSGSGEDGGITTLNQRAPQLLSIAKQTQGGSFPVEEIMTPDERDWFIKSKGINYDKESNTYKPSYKIMGVEPGNTNKKYNLTNAISVMPTQKYVIKDGQIFLQANAIYDADNPQNENPHFEGTFGENFIPDELRHNWKDGNAEDFGIIGMDGKDVWVGEVLIPVTQEFTSGIYTDGLNKMLNIRSNQEGTYGSVNNQEYQQQFQQSFQMLKQQYPDVSDDIIMEALKRM
jgi:hypothetical protein